MSRVGTGGDKRGPLPARIGTLLVAPGKGLADVEQYGGGFRDAFWLVLIAVVAFRSDQLARELFAISHVALSQVIPHMLGTFSREVQQAAMVVLPASVLLTVFAGRGRRDPGRDMELGAACYVPFFAVQAVLRTMDLPGLGGPLSSRVQWWGLVASSLLALVFFVLGLRIARRRVVATTPVEGAPAPAVEDSAAPPAASPVPRPPPLLVTRVAVTLLAGVIGVALYSNVTWIARHAGAVRPLPTGGDAPHFVLPRVDATGGNIDLHQLRGKVVVLDFWATWCMPCLKMMPTMHTLYAKWATRGVEFVGIHTADVPAGDITAFLQQRASPYPIVRDHPDDSGAAGSVALAYKVMGLPHIVILDAEGNIQKVFWGYTSEGSLDGAISGLISPS